MTTVMVTGATGFIGRHILDRLERDSNARTIAVIHNAKAAGRWKVAATVAADLAHAGEVRSMMGRWRPDTVIHAAGRAEGDAAALWRDNLEATSNLLDAAAAESPQALVVLLGSAAEYGPPVAPEPLKETSPCRPTSVYGQTKLAMTNEAMARAARGEIQATVVRPFNVIGPGMGPGHMLGAFLEKARSAIPGRNGSRVVRMGRLDTIRDFVAVTDLVIVIEQIIERRIAGEIINACTGRGQSAGSLLARMLTLVDADIRIESDLSLLRETDVPAAIGDPEKCRRLLDFVPGADLDATLLSTWASAMPSHGRAVS
jgi:nucleoside-diphosphate-sugar epimerase